MTNRIIIKTGRVEVEAELNESLTARKVWAVLPLETSGDTWGDEIYFNIPVEMGEENPVAVVEMGDLAYWPSGAAFCIFFGPTPVSSKDEIKPASSVNIIGKIIGDTKEFKKYRAGEKIKITKVAE